MRIIKQVLFICLFIAYLQIGIGQSYGIEKHSAQASENVLGEWQQVAFRDGKWETLARFLLDKKQDVYFMTRVDKGGGTPLFKKKPRGVFDVGIKDNEWHFKSDWGNGEIGEFRLKQVAPGLYIGWSYLNGKKVEQNLWLRIK